MWECLDQAIKEEAATEEKRCTLDGLCCLIADPHTCFPTLFTPAPPPSLPADLNSWIREGAGCPESAGRFACAAFELLVYTSLIFYIFGACVALCCLYAAVLFCEGWPQCNGEAAFWRSCVDEWEAQQNRSSHPH